VTAILLVFLLGVDWRYLFFGPIMAAGAYVSGFKLRAHGQMNNLIGLTGRETTWQKRHRTNPEFAVPGLGFNADRILLNAEHMHNSYLHAALHAGLIGAFFFAATFVSLWVVIIRSRLIFGPAKSRARTDRFSSRPS